MKLFRIYTICLIIILWSSSLWAACSWTGSTGTVANSTQSAFDDCISTASSKTDPVIINLANSSVTWSGNSDVDVSSWTATHITIQGGGSSTTIITVGSVDTVLSLTAGTKLLVLKNIGFVDGRTANHVSGMVTMSSTATDSTGGFRVTGCAFSGMSDTGGNDTWAMSTFGYGLIDNCTFTAYDQSAGGIRTFSNSSWTAWKNPLTFGDAKALVIENCTFTWPVAGGQPDIIIDGYYGARWILRYSDINNANWGGHGLDSGENQRSPVSSEVYNNSFFSNNLYVYGPVIRGGTSLVHDNSYSGTHSWDGPMPQYFRACEGTSSDPQWKLVYNTSDLKMCSNINTDGSYTGTIQTCNSNGDCTASTCNRMFLSTANDTICTVGDTNCTRYFDGSGTGNYPGRDQPGRGPNQELRPIYVWNNGGHTVEVGGNCDAEWSTYILEGRDYCNHSPATACGTVSGWSYTPYTCPHPLTGLSEGCDSGTVGLAGYNTGGGSSGGSSTTYSHPKLGTGGKPQPGTGSRMTIQ